MFREYNFEKIFMGRLEKNSDLFESLVSFMEQKGIRSGTLEGIGALQEVKIAYYNQISKEYIPIEINEPVEVLSLIGNISLKDGKPFPHCHIIVGDKSGNVKGGHLLKGCKIFAFEFVIKQFDGSGLIRGFDKETRLPLWQFNL